MQSVRVLGGFLIEAVYVRLNIGGFPACDAFAEFAWFGETCYMAFVFGVGMIAPFCVWLMMGVLWMLV